ncbi:MAG: tRNA pseudouridine(13) synthase TruD [Nitrospirae bacterium]|nr:tRNA pseudouridine(13) synthase TruD [Nitrospirota bacterium]
MKIKVKPADFVVRELIRVPPACAGSAHAVLRLSKQGLSTLEAVQVLARLWRVPAGRIHVAGQKDKYAVTEQVISVDTDAGRIRLPVGPERPESQPDGRLRVAYLSRAERPVGPDLLEGNRFEVVIRDIPPMETEKLARAYTEVLNLGFVNYFGEQRFGSARHGRGFFARELVRGREEEALRLFLATPSRKDRSRLKAFKNRVRARWGDWDACLAGAPRAPERNLILYLRNHPKDFRGAVQHVPRSLLSLFLSAYQSHLWNETLRRYLTVAYGPRMALFPFRNELVRWAFYRVMPDTVFEELRGEVLPSIDRRVELPEGAAGEVMRSVLAEEGVQQRDFALPWLRGAFFKSVSRRMVVVPEDFEIDPPGDDEVYERRRKVAMRFTLPPGSYATVLLRRLLM